MSNPPPALRIADFSTHLSGPLASHLLAEMGATVIKIENPRGGDGNRGTPPFINGEGMLHLALNAGTRSLAVDRRSEHWPAVVEACARWADVVIVGARPKDALKRGLDFATMHRANPRIVYCAVSGFGNAGPWSDYTAHGQTIDALAGSVPVDWSEGTPKTARGWRSAGTTLGGVFAALGILNAIYRRDHGADHAQYVSQSLWGAALWWKWRDIAMLANTGEAWTDYSDFGSRHALYETADKRAMLIAPAEKKFWERFCDVAELPADWRSRGAWGEGSGMDTGAGPAYADEPATIAARMKTRTLEEWTRLFAANEIPFAPILELEEAMRSEHAAANGLLRAAGAGSMKIAASPVRIAVSEAGAEAPLPPLSPPPRIGEHTREILEELGVAHLHGRLQPAGRH